MAEGGCGSSCQRCALALLGKVIWARGEVDGEFERPIALLPLRQLLYGVCAVVAGHITHMLPCVLADGHPEVHAGCGCKARVEVGFEVAGLVEHIVGRQQLLAAGDFAAATGSDAHRAVGRLGALAARIDGRANE